MVRLFALQLGCCGFESKVLCLFHMCIFSEISVDHCMSYGFTISEGCSLQVARCSAERDRIHMGKPEVQGRSILYPLAFFFNRNREYTIYSFDKFISQVCILTH